MKKHPHSFSGFGLTEVIIAVTLLSVVLTGFLSMMRQQQRGIASLSQSADFENLVYLLRLSLSNATNCPAALQNAAGTPITPPNTVSIASPNLPASGLDVDKISIGSLTLSTANPYNQLKIVSMKVEQVTVGNPNPASPSPYIATLAITVEKPNGGGASAVGGSTLMKKIPISMTLQDSGTAIVIAGCSTTVPAPTTSLPVTSASWIDFPPGNTYAGYYMAWPILSPVSTPTAWCVSQGYARPSGRCLINAAFVAEGSLAANRSLGYWTWSCMYGNGAWFASPGQVKLECVN